MANEGSTKPTYSELEAQLAELKRGLRNNNSDFEMAFLDHYLDHFKTLTKRAETAETSLARVLGLLQRLIVENPICHWCWECETGAGAGRPFVHASDCELGTFLSQDAEMLRMNQEWRWGK